MAIDVTNAMVFAAGFGTRLRPRTDRTPKPLIEVAGRSMLERALDGLERAGVQRAVVNTHHLAAQVHDAVLARRRLGRGPDVVLVHEEPILETGGGLVNALGLLGESPFVSLNADVIWTDGPTPAVHRLARQFDPDRMDALLLLARVDEAIGYAGQGDFELAADGQLIRSAGPSRSLVFTGLQLWQPRVFAARSAQPFSLAEIYRERTQDDGRVTGCYGLVHDGAWLHVGTELELRAADAYLASLHE